MISLLQPNRLRLLALCSAVQALASFAAPIALAHTQEPIEPPVVQQNEDVEQAQDDTPPDAAPAPGLYTVYAVSPQIEATQELHRLEQDPGLWMAMQARCLTHPIWVDEDQQFTWLRPPRNRRPGYRVAQRWSCDLSTQPARCPMAPGFRRWPTPTPDAQLSSDSLDADSFALRYHSVTLIHHACAQTPNPGLLDATTPDSESAFTDTVSQILEAIHR